MRKGPERLLRVFIQGWSPINVNSVHTWMRHGTSRTHGSSSCLVMGLGHGTWLRHMGKAKPPLAGSPHKRPPRARDRTQQEGEINQVESTVESVSLYRQQRSFT